MKDLKNIIFDLGGVLLGLDENKTRKQLLHLSEHFRYLETEPHSQILKNYEKGLVSSDDFIRQMIEFARQGNPALEIRPEQVADAWNAMLLSFPLENIRMLEQLKSRYRVFLLSNTNDLHWTCLMRQFKAEHPDCELESLFETCFLSYEMGERKPDLAIYQKVLSQAGLRAEETLFIDDKANNIRAAETLGIQACWLHDEKVGELIRKKGLL